MRLINIGSLNIDNVYSVEHLMVPGETIDSKEYIRVCGGKGLNQSVAAANAGMKVYQAGMVGRDGQILISFLKTAGIDVSKVIVNDKQVTGHTVIQVDSNGQNSIILYGGANRAITEDCILSWLSDCDKDDILLLQNEVSCVDKAIDIAKTRGMKIVMNPSPITEGLFKLDLGKLDLLVLNEIEGEILSGEKEYENIISALNIKYPDTAILLTLGSKGAEYSYGIEKVFCKAFNVQNVVDTTAAGDTFTGYFVDSWSQGVPASEALKRASAASAIAVGIAGAAPSIPQNSDVDAFLKKNL